MLLLFSLQSSLAPMQNTTRRTCSRHIVIAEDHDEFRRLLSESFRAEGYTVTECGNGMELVGLLGSIGEPGQKNGVELIISDIRMPGVTGMSILAGLHAIKNGTPIILITAFGDEKTHAEAQSFGAAAIIDKPFEIVDLIRKVEAILEDS